jgi:hypothetical protein
MLPGFARFSFLDLSQEGLVETVHDVRMLCEDKIV